MHWNNGAGQVAEDGTVDYLLAFDCVESAGHDGWCRSEILDDDVSTHRLYWDRPTPDRPDGNYDTILIRSTGPPAVATGEPVDENQLSLFG